MTAFKITLQVLCAIGLFFVVALFLWSALLIWAKPTYSQTADERAAGLEALAASYRALYTTPTTHLGPAVLRLDRPWIAERMPIAVHYPPTNDPQILPPHRFDHDYAGTVLLTRV